MANFERLFHFEKFVPNLGNNRELLTDQLTLDLAVGLTKVQLRAFARGPKEANEAPAGSLSVDEAQLQGSALELARIRLQNEAFKTKLAELWGPYVKMGPGNHSVEGVPITSLRDYLSLVVDQPGIFNLIELREEVMRLNSVEGTRALFSDAPAGGSTSTRRPSVGLEGSQTGVH